MRYILCFIALMINTSYAQTIKKGPYLLYDNDNTRMEVLWQDDLSGTDTIKWGNDTLCSAGTSVVSEFGAEHQHRVILNGLEPGTKYNYCVQTRLDSYCGTFVTAPPAGQANLEFYAYGDSRTGVADHNFVAGKINESWIEDPASQTFILSMGDLTSDGNYEYYWTKEMFNPPFPNIRQMMANIPMMACRGNHEGNAKIFGKYFTYPYFSTYYYSMNYGPVHIAFVDVYTRITPGSAQYKWLVNDLSLSSSPWKFVVLHTPAWSAAGGHANSTMVQNIVVPLCEQYDVSILFAGHNHYYARAVTREENGDSLIHITTGGGGGPLHVPLDGQPNVVTATSCHHFCKINIVDNDLLRFTAISDSGVVIDQFVIDRSATTVPDHSSKNYLNVKPNPFTDNTLISYTLEDSARVKLSFFNIDGEEVRQLMPETRQSRGSYSLSIDGTGLSRGVYICKMLVINDNGRRDSVSCKVVLAK
jgi:hypothetical protein